MRHGIGDIDLIALAECADIAVLDHLTVEKHGVTVAVEAGMLVITGANRRPIAQRGQREIDDVLHRQEAERDPHRGSLANAAVDLDGLVGWTGDDLLDLRSAAGVRGKIPLRRLDCTQQFLACLAQSKDLGLLMCLERVEPLRSALAMNRSSIPIEISF